MSERDPDTEDTEAMERSVGGGQGPQTLAQLRATGAEVLGSDGERLGDGDFVLRVLSLLPNPFFCAHHELAGRKDHHRRATGRTLGERIPGLQGVSCSAVSTCGFMEKRQ